MFPRFLPVCSFLLLAAPALAQCGVGEVEVTIAIRTDNYGYETYWQLVPGMNACGDGTIFEGGNLLIGCAGGGAQAQQPGGYPSNDTIVEGPWCLMAGEFYTIHMLDDWGDGQATPEVFVDGVSVGVFPGDGPANAYTFGKERDMSITDGITAIYANTGTPTRVLGTVRAFGSQPVSEFALSYSENGGTPVTATISGVNIAPGSTYAFEHPLPWLPSSTGPAELDVYISSINGADDQNSLNDHWISAHVISPAIPDLAADYLAEVPLVETIATSDQDILIPRDLAFHPESGLNQLWVINKDTEESGGSTVTFYDAGEPGQTHEWRKDVNSWHFMSLPTGIAMSDNNNFATCPGVFDANHNGGDPFTGPSLWSADTAVYCRFYGGLGSHLDMLHNNPNSQGIAHEYWNRFWVVDGYSGDVVMNDFKKDHGPGNDYHGNGIIRRYSDFTITRDPADHIVSHAVMDKSTGMLYVVDHGGRRVLRMDVNTGEPSGPATIWGFEQVVEYSVVTGYDWAEIISEGLVEPAGIEVVGTHLYVSDHANGDIVIYDIADDATPELGRIHTGDAGLMGITVGPDGRIWGVNATTSELLRVSPETPNAVREVAAGRLLCWPNPADERIVFECPEALRGNARYTLFDPAGRIIRSGTIPGRIGTLPVEGIPNGPYTLEIRTELMRWTASVAIAH